MALFFLASTIDGASFAGGTIVQAFDPVSARDDAEAAGLHVPGAPLSIVTQLDAASVPPELIGRKLSRAEIPAAARWREETAVSIGPPTHRK
jgi:hypothetical protein